MIKTWPLFWCLEPKAQAALMLFQFQNYGTKLDIPAPPQTSRGVWLNTQLENADEIERIMRRAPSRSRGKSD